jgi:hypothetical protein
MGRWEVNFPIRYRYRLKCYRYYVSTNETAPPRSIDGNKTLDFVTVFDFRLLKCTLAPPHCQKWEKDLVNTQ